MATSKTSDSEIQAFNTTMQRAANEIKIEQKLRKLQKYLCAMACDFQQCGILTNVDSDEPVQPPLKLRNSK